MGNMNTVLLGVIAICGLVLAGFVSRETVENVGLGLALTVLGLVALLVLIQIGKWWSDWRKRQEARHQAWLATPKGQRQMYLLKTLGRGLLGLLILPYSIAILVEMATPQGVKD